jgi:hypothetical protein
MWFQDIANNLKAQGKDDTFMRSWVRMNAGLTVQEESVLEAIAADCEANTSAAMSAAQALAPTAANPGVAQQIQSLQAQRQQTVLSHMSQLQSAFGPARYALLDAFARQIVKFGASAPVPVGFVPNPPPAVPVGK